jgi:hypothetical protein
MYKPSNTIDDDVLSLNASSVLKFSFRTATIITRNMLEKQFIYLLTTNMHLIGNKHFLKH